ncbi:MAG: 1-acyl-sn-glycerol-3-phosphate acyltransferase [Proteobacteria bacterium]|nr:1-acyl-sn-glycerol-3-phosphate acyltransferase [Pseudomonadota bacterium]
MVTERQASDHIPPQRFTDKVLDSAVTLICWTWFIFGFLFFFSWAYLAAALFVKNPEVQFQRLNFYFFRVFFRVVRTIAPRQKIEIDDRIAAIQSSVVVCNHLSYLDPLLLIALFPRQKTIVKPRFFGTPIFGWMLKKSGYLPASSEGRFSRLMIEQMETMGSYLGAGGNLFIFPEGTRSRDGKIGNLNQGAMKIARMCKSPLYVLQLRNTDKLFTPGKFLFNSRIPNTMHIKILDHIEPDYQNAPPSTTELEQQVRQAFTDNQI